MPERRYANEPARQEIARLTEEFLKAGGTIKQCTHEDNAMAAFQPFRPYTVIASELKERMWRATNELRKARARRTG